MGNQSQTFSQLESIGDLPLPAQGSQRLWWEWDGNASSCNSPVPKELFALDDPALGEGDFQGNGSLETPIFPRRSSHLSLH